MTKRSTTHASFTIERTFDAPPAKVYAAFADPKEKAKWFAGPEDWEQERSKMDFRIGGRETSSGGPVGGPVHTFNALYWDIVPNERIVYTYEMLMGDTRISVSLATIEIAAAGKGTKLKLIEDGAFLDGYDDVGSREHGTKELIEALGKSLG